MPPIVQYDTAVSTKVVPQKRKSARDNADWYYMGRKSLALIVDDHSVYKQEKIRHKFL